MNAKDILGLIVRLFGLLLSAYGIYSLIFAIEEVAGYAPQAHYSAESHLLHGVINTILGLVLIRSAKFVENFCYPENKKS